jgi:circadian clock protein KaiC
MLQGGISQSSSIMVVGSLGTGKTLFSLHYLLAGAQKCETRFYLTFHESYEELYAKAANFDLDLRGAVEQGLITLLALSSVQVEPDIVANYITEQFENKPFQRFVLDGYDEVERVAHAEGRTFDFAAAMIHYLKQNKVTAMFTHEIPKIVGTDLDLSSTAFMRLAESIILLRHVEHKAKLYRILSILKMRDSEYDQTIREFTIENKKGINILQPIDGEYGLLTGLARSHSID